jgi:hypothetical protein
VETSDLEGNGPLLRAPDINARQLRGALDPNGQWRWFVGTRGPTVKGVPMYVWWWAGDTREQAERVALELGPLPAEGDEAVKATAIAERIRTTQKSN